MSNIITKAHPVPDMHSTGLRVVGVQTMFKELPKLNC